MKRWILLKATLRLAEKSGKTSETFWEVYIPGDDFSSPNGCYLVNSACHSSGNAPTYFLRRQNDFIQ